MSYGTSGGSGDIRKQRSPCVVLATCIVLGFASGAVASGCKDNPPAGGDVRPATVTTAAASTSAKGAVAPKSSASVAAVAASASASSSASAAAAPPPPAEPIGAGVSAFVPAGQTDTCKTQTGQIADYLQRGEVSLAAREGTVAAAWLIKLSPARPDAQLAFAGFSLDAKQVARARGVGTSLEFPPKLFTSGAAGWTLVWFDAEGLAYTKPRWETSPPLVIEHLRAIRSADAENVALASTPEGSIIAIAPFVADKSQLGMFSFAPVDPGAPAVQALGATHHAKKPRWPAVAADAKGYTLVWHEDGDQIVVSRFDLKGRELGEAVTLSEAGPWRGRVTITPTTNGAIAAWSEGDKLLARAIDQDARPAAETYVIGQGKMPSLVPVGDGALVVYTGQDGTAANQVLAVKLGPNAAPSAKGMRLTDAGPVKEPPVGVAVGSRVAFLWAEPMGVGVPTKKALLRTVEAACIP